VSITFVPTPTSRLRFGVARTDITPPVGIYHRMWGAARHDRATGVHRPLTAEVLAFGPSDGAVAPFLRVHFDMVGLATRQYGELAAAIAEASGVPIDHVTLLFSHSHSAGFFLPDRAALPGGELIAPYLTGLHEKLRTTAAEAIADLRPATITYASGRCAMNGNRDFSNPEGASFVCGFNPGAAGDDTVLVARVTDEAGAIQATLVHYACHPTTLAWDNTLISPDYIGAMRETVERVTGVPCVFALGACGDLGPRDGFSGDPEVADRNGRQLGYAALSALQSMPAPGLDFAYAGAVVSGATLGTWRHVPQEGRRREETLAFSSGGYAVDLPKRSLPDPDDLQAEIVDWQTSEQRAADRGDAVGVRDCRARAERARRWLGRLADMPPGTSYPLRFSVLRTGDAVWVACAGEPYSALQAELRRRFPQRPVIVSPLAGGLQVAYLLPEERYGLGLYQEEPSILAPGCLERLTEAIAARIAEHLA
jgi:hypothetical protein